MALTVEKNLFKTSWKLEYVHVVRIIGEVIVELESVVEWDCFPKEVEKYFAGEWRSHSIAILIVVQTFLKLYSNVISDQIDEIKH